MSANNEVIFDVLLRGTAAAAGDIPTAGNVAAFRAPPDAIERCRRWLAAEGITCFATDFGLACTCDAETFESVFSVELQPAEDPATGWRMAGPALVPAAISELVEQVTIARAPELF